MNLSKKIIGLFLLGFVFNTQASVLNETFLLRHHASKEDVVKAIKKHGTYDSWTYDDYDHKKAKSFQRWSDNNKMKIDLFCVESNKVDKFKLIRIEFRSLFHDEDFINKTFFYSLNNEKEKQYVFENLDDGFLVLNLFYEIKTKELKFRQEMLEFLKDLDSNGKMKIRYISGNGTEHSSVLNLKDFSTAIYKSIEKCNP